MGGLSIKLNYQFNKADLFEQALTHRSAASQNYERLEFIGDSILSCVIAHAIYQQKPLAAEGELSRLRASLVNEQALADIAKDLNLGECLRLGPGELKSGGFRRESILADAVEAIIGAVFLDGGFAAAQALILNLYGQRLTQLPDIQAQKDPKTQLQEWLQGRGSLLPEYELVWARGKPHEQLFCVRCFLSEQQLTAEGEGRSRRIAEQVAAEKILQQLQDLK
ncbi:MAG: ribonuclease III [Gammaproteobacteria bacterium]|nr:ribonuclease III [Gammaproteobacteria bacterium]